MLPLLFLKFNPFISKNFLLQRFPLFWNMTDHFWDWKGPWVQGLEGLHFPRSHQGTTGLKRCNISLVPSAGRCSRVYNSKVKTRLRILEGELVQQDRHQDCIRGCRSWADSREKLPSPAFSLHWIQQNSWHMDTRAKWLFQPSKQWISKRPFKSIPCLFSIHLSSTASTTVPWDQHTTVQCKLDPPVPPKSLPSLRAIQKTWVYLPIYSHSRTRSKQMSISLLWNSRPLNFLFLFTNPISSW